MKALNEMNNVEKAYLLVKLFPERMIDLVEFQIEEAKLHRKNEQYIRSVWTDTLVTADFWFGLIQRSEDITQKMKSSISKSQRVYSDHLFDGYSAIFAMHCLITYASTENCGAQLKEAIHLVFGSQKMFNLELEK